MCSQYSHADANALKMTLETISLWWWRYAVLSLTLLPLVSSILSPASRRTLPTHPYLPSVLSCSRFRKAASLFHACGVFIYLFYEVVKILGSYIYFFLFWFAFSPCMQVFSVFERVYVLLIHVFMYACLIHLWLYMYICVLRICFDFDTWMNKYEYTLKGTS